jgi:hypothetical protein
LNSVVARAVTCTGVGTWLAQNPRLVVRVNETQNKRTYRNDHCDSVDLYGSRMFGLLEDRKRHLSSIGHSLDLFSKLISCFYVCLKDAHAARRLANPSGGNYLGVLLFCSH